MDSPVPARSTSQLDHRIARYRGEVLAFLRRRAPTDAEELAQDVWLKVTLAQPHCPDDPSFRAFAYTVARRLLIDRHRRRARRGPLVPVDGGLEPVSASDPHSQVCAQHALKVVEATLKAMKPELAQVFRWRMTTDLSFRDIALRQSVSINTALGRHHSATKKIAAALRVAGLTPESP